MVPALIPEYFAGRSVFITGATGFMGKVLVERLLWTCPDIERLYLLMRIKNGVPPKKRLAHLKQSQIFDIIREKCPHQLDKIWPVPGDVTVPRLGIEENTIHRLREVSVVLHSAATLKFDEPLATAVDLNVRSVIFIMDLCDQLPNLQVFVYVSTAYSNAELSRVEERVYPATSVDSLLALVDNVPEDILAEIKPKLISPKPNTYTFTKAVAETVVERRGARANYCTAIFRPSIVVSSLRSPFPGWIENLNGPSGVIVGTGKGLLHVFSCIGAARADMVPVDIAVDTLIAVAWETALNHRIGSVLVYNCSSCENPTTWGAFTKSFVRSVRQHPFNDPLWYPYLILIGNSLVHRVSETALQTIPLQAGDYLLSLCGFKTQLSLSKVCQRLHAMNNALKFFALRQWDFATGNVQRLRARLSAADASIYNLDPHTIDWEEHCVDFVKGVRKYLLRQRDQDIEKAKRRMFKLYIAHSAMLVGMLMLIAVTLLWRMFEYSYRHLASGLSLSPPPRDELHPPEAISAQVMEVTTPPPSSSKLPPYLMEA